MAKQAKERDEWGPLVEALKRGKNYTKGDLTTWERLVPLSAIDREAPVQFREQLSQTTLESMGATLENGGTLANVVLVEAVRAEPDDAEEEPRWRTAQREDPVRCHLVGDGNHRITTIEQHHAAQGATEEGAEPTIKAMVITGAPDPLALARELSVRLNATPPTPPTENERQKCALILRELHPEWSLHQIARLVGYAYPTTRNIINRQEVREHLERVGIAVPSNAILEVLHDHVSPEAWGELARTSNREHWRAADLQAAADVAERIATTDWSEVRDGGGEVHLNRDWGALSEAERVRLAYHYAVKQDLPDEQIIWAAGALHSMRYMDDQSWADQARDILSGEWEPERWGWPAPAAPEPEPEPPTAVAPQPEVVPPGTSPAPASDNEKAPEPDPLAQQRQEAEEALRWCRTAIEKLAGAVGTMEALGAELGPALAAKGGSEPAHLRALAGDLVAAASNVEVMARDAARARAASP